MTDSVGPGLDLDAVWRQHSRRVLATLIRLLRDFDLAEEALHDAFLAAARKWPEQGIPANPSAWLISAGRFRAIDRLRQGFRFAAVQEELGVFATEAIEPEAEGDITDDQLRLIFTCCHPSLAPEAQVALTLRSVCGLTTEEIARAFLVRTPTLAQRIVRAKQRIMDDGLRYEIPGVAELPERLASVLRVIYLVFNEGYVAHSGQNMLRTDLTAEAIRLGRLLADLLPDGEVIGLLGLMLLHEARKTARISQDGEIILLVDQDRDSWDPRLIAEGTDLVRRAFAARQVGPYALQGAIAAVHMAARSPAQTDWAEILGLYTVLSRIAPSSVVRLNRAIAVSMVHGPQAALDLIAPLADSEDLAAYHLAHAAKADMLRQLNRMPEALAAYRRALSLCRLEPERRVLLRRIAEVEDNWGKP
jgi:RNA polymerase sigma-70 factor, ECF subfamily